MGICLSSQSIINMINPTLYINKNDCETSVSVDDCRRRGQTMEHNKNGTRSSLEHIMEMFGSLGNSLGYLNNHTKWVSKKNQKVILICLALLLISKVCCCNQRLKENKLSDKYSDIKSWNSDISNNVWYCNNPVR